MGKGDPHHFRGQHPGEIACPAGTIFRSGFYNPGGSAIGPGSSLNMPSSIP